MHQFPSEVVECKDKDIRRPINKFMSLIRVPRKIQYHSIGKILKLFSLHAHLSRLTKVNVSINKKIKIGHETVNCVFIDYVFNNIVYMF